MDSQETTKRPQEEALSDPIDPGGASINEPAAKKMKIDASEDATHDAPRPRVKGVAPIKAE